MAAFCVLFVWFDVTWIYLSPRGSMMVLSFFFFQKGFVVSFLSFSFFLFDGFIVTFVSLPGSDFTQVRQCKGVVVDALHVEKQNKTKTCWHCKIWARWFKCTIISINIQSRRSRLHMLTGNMCPVIWSNWIFHHLLCRNKKQQHLFNVDFFSISLTSSIILIQLSLFILNVLSCIQTFELCLTRRFSHSALTA